MNKSAALKRDAGSFRDRNNRVYDDGTLIVRGISRAALGNWTELASQPFFKELMDTRKIVQTSLLDSKAFGDMDESWAAYLQHERIPFVTYPYEWSFSMLKDAALLQLDLIERAIEAGWTMKDATAYNIQWIGARPIFIDVPSFEPYTPGEPWAGYRQFCMMFLYPLMIQAYRRVPFNALVRSSLEGIDPAVANNILSGFSRLRKGVPTHVYLHSKMQSRYSSADMAEAKKLTEDSELEISSRKALHHSQAMVLGVIQGLRRIVTSLSEQDRSTVWKNYDTDHSYAEESFDAKRGFVECIVQMKRRGLVWDLGCNTGTFSRLCAKNADYVVSVDGDAQAIDRLYIEEKKRGENKILPCIADLGNMSPGQGWRGEERKAFDRRSQPELILCLALIHHVVITANIPLAEFLGWLRQFNAEVVIEFVSLDDDMSKILLRNKNNQYSDLTESEFERLVSRTFNIASSESLKRGHRKIYHLVPA